MYEFALLLLTFKNEAYAEFICATNVEVNMPLDPKVQKAITNVVRRKAYWSPYCFYDWGYHTDIYNVNYARDYYWRVNKLPELPSFERLPPQDFVSKQFEISYEYEKLLDKLKATVSPWEEHNLQFLKEESNSLQSIWAKANQMYLLKENQLQTRIMLQELREMLDGDESLLWNLPAFPTWRLR